MSASTCRWRYRRDVLTGILNGIDTDVWDPSTDRHIASNGSTPNASTTKVPNRAALARAARVPRDDVPLAVAVTRLTDQKGIDLLVPLVRLLDQIPMRLAVLGSGDALAGGARSTLRPPRTRDWFAFVEGYDESLSHLMFAGADLYVMPSRFEPCGLTQMQAMRYGTVPIVTGVGGLVDTVPDADADRRDGVASSPRARRRPTCWPRCSAPCRRITDRRATRHAAAPRDGGRLVVARAGDRVPRAVRTVRRRALSTLGRMAEPKVLVIVLAGGEGKRLLPLTNDRAKPAVPFGGSYRLIDFALSNFANARYLKIVVLTQYKSHSLDRHISQTWRFSTMLDNYVTPVPAQMRRGPQWFQGSADAIYQNLNLIHDESPDLVCVFGADHIYRMDPRQMVEHHVDSGAGVTVAAIPVPKQEARRLRGDRVERRRQDHRLPREVDDPADDAGRQAALPGEHGQLRVRHADADRHRHAHARTCTPTSAAT